MTSGIYVAWREAKSVVLGLTGLSLLAWLARWRWLAALSALLLGWVFYFFRDPERVPASVAPEWILSPADGRVMDIGLVEDPHFFNGPARRVTVFLSLFDVHVQRAPYQARVEFVRYQSGSFLPAFLSGAQANESNLIGLSTPRGPLGVQQIAGLLARRIVCRVAPGDTLYPAQRLGLIKFGSRVDLLLPPTVEVLTHVGQKLYAGQTIVARWPDEPI